MLQLKNIVKNYVTGDTTVEALKGINITFRENEFVSILGPSGCGKTTMLNIIGGLDHYTSGDLVINGVSTKQYKSRNWDSYRNHSVGFVFQSYNLIPHQSVLSNVELALTLTGVSKKERRERAIDALKQVGLGDQIHKRPNQMSGGQMQRVAIARALVNNPDILLADEPTGALDTQTSVQIMEILKEIAKDRLIIMVTHNPELAEQYSTRIVKLLDGNIIDDSDKYEVSEEDVEKEKEKSEETLRNNKKKTSMSFFTALSLSLNNLMTKKARTFLTAFAGSIGIIGIALILSLSSGIQEYIDDVQRDTLTSYPITIQKETMDMTAMVETMSGHAEGEDHSDEDAIYSNDVMVDVMGTVTQEIRSNNLKDFKKYLDNNKDIFSEDVVSNIQYSYNVPIIIYKETKDGVLKINPSSLFDTIGAATGMSEQMGGSNSMMVGMNVWMEMLDNQDLLKEQYDIIAGDWPKNSDEVVLYVDKNNQISDFALYSLGLKDKSELEAILKSLMEGKEYTPKQTSYTFDEILDTKFKLVLPTDYYQLNDTTGVWEDKSEDTVYMASKVANAKEIKVVGILRPNEDNKGTAGAGGIGYTSGLAKYIIGEVNESEVVKAQIDNPKVDIFTGMPFEADEIIEVTMEMIQEYIATLPPEEQEQFNQLSQTMSQEQLMAMMKQQMESMKTTATYDTNMTKLGVCDLEVPSMINIYAATFEAKDTISDAIEDYNKKMRDEGKEEDVIEYTDYIGIMMSSVTTIINAISYVLIAFVAISLVVSSIMIGIITYISVLERTKEIGILRAIGASKKDVSRVFNAETIIVGFSAGFIGIAVTMLLNIPINAIILHLTDIKGLSKLPTAGAIALIIISVVLTFIAGLFPAKIAARKDPVEALRSE